MDLLEQLAEARIQQASEAGELSNLPGEGKPLQLDDDSAIPAELRMGYRILKNAGFLPLELQLRKEISSVEEMLSQAQGASEHSRALLRLQVLQMRLSASRRQAISLQLEESYYQQLVKRVGH